MLIHFRWYVFRILLGVALAIAIAFPATAAPQNQPPAIAGIAHVAFQTSNAAAARHFYHNILGFDEVFDVPARGTTAAFFKVNDHQYVEIYPGLRSPQQDRLVDIAFETTDARALRRFIAGGGFAPGALHRLAAGSIGFGLTDPSGHRIEFVQYVPDSLIGRGLGKHLSKRRISTRIIHAGVTVPDRSQEDRLYKSLLDFHVMWYGGRTDQEVDWVDMRVPQGHDWLEYMLNVHNPSPRALGVMHHFALGVPSVSSADAAILKRGYQPRKPQIGRDGKWQLNLFDPDGTRIELMEPKPVRTPCCSPMVLN
ncbi:MAG: VOC family protein [Terriglobia bacterium]